MHPQHSESDPVSTAWNEVATYLIVNGIKYTGKGLNRQLKNNNNGIVIKLNGDIWCKKMEKIVSLSQSMQKGIQREKWRCS